jgi:hypothetical protein
MRSRFSLFQKITKKPTYTWKGFLIAFILGGAAGVIFWLFFSHRL